MCSVGYAVNTKTLFIHVRRCSLRQLCHEPYSHCVCSSISWTMNFRIEISSPSGVERMQQVQSINLLTGSMDRSWMPSSRIKCSIQIVGKLLNYVVLDANMNFEFTRCAKHPTTEWRLRHRQSKRHRSVDAYTLLVGIYEHRKLEC